MSFLIWVILAFLLSHYLHWIAGILSALALVPLAKMNLRESLIMGFLSLSLVWAGYAALLNTGNAGVLSNAVGELFGGLSGPTMVIITGFLGGVGGLLAGWMSWSLFRNTRNASQ